MDATRAAGNEFVSSDSSERQGPNSNLAEEATDPRVARSRAKMLAAATALLVEAGPRAVTVDAVVERSGVAKSTLYRHWDSRTALVIDVVRCNVPDLEPIDLVTGFDASLRAAVRSIADSFADPEWIKILPALLSLKHQMPELEAISHDDQHDKITQLDSILELGAAEGRLPTGLDAHTAARFLIGPIMFAALTGPAANADEVHAIADQAVERFIDHYRDHDRDHDRDSSSDGQPRPK